MAKKKCSECAEKIQAEARKCKHCGAVVEPPPQKPKNRTGCLLLILLGLALSVGVALSGSNASPQSQGGQPSKVRPNGSAKPIPDYTVVERINLLAGGIWVAALLNKALRQAPAAELERVARAIAAKEGATEVSLYCSEQARKADFSEKFSKRHPSADKCNLGTLSAQGFTN